MMKSLMAAAVIVASAWTMWAQAPAPAKKAYLLVQSDVTNPQQYAEYVKLTPAIIEKFGGRFIARGGQSTTVEGRAAPGRVAVVEFPSYERAQAYYASPEYQDAMKKRAGAATMQMVIVEGL